MFKVDVFLHSGIQCAGLLSVALHAGAFSGQHFPVLALVVLQGAQEPRLLWQVRKEALDSSWLCCVPHV